MENAQRRFFGRWQSLFSVNAPVVLRLRSRSISALEQIIANPKIDLLYRNLLQDYELPILNSFKKRAISEGNVVEIDYKEPDLSAVKLGFALNQYGHSSHYLQSRSHLFRKKFIEVDSSVAGVVDDYPVMVDNKFQLSNWAAFHKRRPIDVYFITPEWKKFTPKLHGLRRMLPDQLDPLILSALFEIIPDGFDPQKAKIIKINTESVDINDALDNALKTFAINKNIYNLALTKFGLDPFGDFFEGAIVSGTNLYSGQLFCVRLNWKYRSVKIERIKQEIRGKTSLIAKLIEASPSFKAALSAFTDCFDYAPRRDNQYILKTLSTGLESLLAPLTESTLAINLRGKSGRVAQSRLCAVLSKIISFDVCRQISENISQELNVLRKQKHGRSDDYIKVQNLTKLDRSAFVQYGYSIIGDDVYMLAHKHDFILRAGRNISSFFKGSATRFYFDYLHSIISRNLIIHENTYASNDHLINVLLYTFRVILSMRIACFAPSDSEPEANFAMFVVTMIYEFNRITALDEYGQLPAICSSAEQQEMFHWGFLRWFGTDFTRRFAELDDRINNDVISRVADQKFFSGLNFNGHYMI